MLFGQPVQRLDHQIGGNLVDEIREQHDQRPPRHLGVEIGQGQGVIALLDRIGQGAQLVFQHVEAVRPGQHRPDRLGPRAEAEGADVIADLQPGIAEQQARIDGPVQPFQPGQRLAHQPPSVEGQHDMVVALGLIFARIELHVPRGRAPVDAAMVLRGVVFAQGVVFRPVVKLVLHPHAVDVVEREQVRRVLLDALEVGRDDDVRVQPQRLLHMHEAQRPAPAQVSRLDVRGPARRRPEPQHGLESPVRVARQAAFIVRPRQPRVEIEPQLQHGRRIALERHAQRRLAHAAQIEKRRRLQTQDHALPDRREGRVQHGDRQQGQRRQRNPRPGVRRVNADRQSGGDAQAEQDQKTRRGGKGHLERFPKSVTHFSD